MSVWWAEDGVALNKAVVGVVVLVVVIFAAIGLYVTPGLTSQTGNQVNKSTSKSSATSPPISSTGTSTKSPTQTTPASPTNTSPKTTQSGTLTTQPFSFIFSTSPDLVLLSPGSTQTYVTLRLVPLPSSLASPSESVRLNYSAPSGISVKFADNPVKIANDSGHLVDLTLAVSQSIAPGEYRLVIQGNSGTLTENYTLVVKVVQYLVYIKDFSFSPSNITVRPGSTVFWMNLDASTGVYPVFHTVTFTTGSTSRSPSMQQYNSYSTAFTDRGSYLYHCEFHPDSMNGVVIVLGG